MLWHGIRAPAVAGVGRLARVDWHSTHESASRSTGSPVRAARRYATLSPVPHPPADDGLARLLRLRTAEGGVAIAWARRLQDDGVDLLAGLARLRSEVGAELAGPAWELA